MFGFSKDLKEYEYTQEELDKFKYAVIKTSKGDMVLELTPKDTPNTVANFATLAKDGFYDNLNFHRVIPSFVIQGGCPNGNGMGGPDWQIKCETSDKQEHLRGALSMAHAGKDTGGSQFFVVLEKQPHLDGVHTVFGQMVDDEKYFKTLDDIKQGDTIETIEIKESLED
jgi:cyclophilin family peptidyl-prolyl cis-trans isomerase